MRPVSSSLIAASKEQLSKETKPTPKKVQGESTAKGDRSSIVRSISSDKISSLAPSSKVVRVDNNASRDFVSKHVSKCDANKKVSPKSVSNTGTKMQKSVGDQPGCSGASEINPPTPAQFAIKFEPGTWKPYDNVETTGTKQRIAHQPKKPRSHEPPAQYVKPSATGSETKATRSEPAAKVTSSTRVDSVPRKRPLPPIVDSNLVQELEDDDDEEVVALTTRPVKPKAAAPVVAVRPDSAPKPKRNKTGSKVALLKDQEVC